MARICDISGTKTITGGNRKHKRGSSGAGGAWASKAPRTLRKWHPNLRKIRVMDGDTPMTLKVSMKVYKKLRKTGAFNA